MTSIFFSTTRLAAVALSTVAVLTPATAQPFPTKAIRAVLPYSAGSGPDAVVRQVGDKLGRLWGQPFVVEDKPGASGWLAISDAKRSAPDGYTLLAVDNSHIALQPHLYKKLPTNPAKELEPVAPLFTTGFFVVVAADSPWNNMTDLINAAKAKSGQLTYGSWGIGSVAHLGSAMLESAANISMTHVPFKELPQMYTSVASHEVDWAFGSAASTSGLVQAGKLKYIALAASKRLAGYTNIPTVGEAGGPAGFELTTWVALYGPKGMPKAVVDRINEGVNKVLGEADTKERFATFGFQPWTGSPADISKIVDADSVRFEKVVKQARISLD